MPSYYALYSHQVDVKRLKDGEAEAIGGILRKYYGVPFRLDCGHGWEGILISSSKTDMSKEPDTKRSLAILELIRANVPHEMIPGIVK